MASKLKVDQIEGQSGTSVEVPTGHTLKVTDLGNNKILSTNSSGVVTATAMGSTDEVLKMTGSNTIGFGTIASGNTVKLNSTTISSSVSNVVFDGFFNDTIYSHYILHAYGLSTTNDSSTSDVYLRMYSSTGTSYTSSNYFSCTQSASATTSGSSNASGRRHGGSFFDFSSNNLEADIGRGFTGFARFYMPQSTTHSLRYFVDSYSFHSGTANHYNISIKGGIDDNSQTYTGFVIYPAGGSLDAGELVLYGVKK